MTRRLTCGRAMTLVIATALSALLEGCDTTKTTTTTTTGPQDPLNFVATDGSMMCKYTYGPGGSIADPDFTLSISGGITVSATYSATYEGPPGSMQITYGDPTTPSFDSGLFSLFPPPSNVTVTENSPTDWSVTFTDPTAADQALSYGGTWTFVFSCGAIPSCCADTTSITVVASGSP